VAGLVLGAAFQDAKADAGGLQAGAGVLKLRREGGEAGAGAGGVGVGGLAGGELGVQAGQLVLGLLQAELGVVGLLAAAGGEAVVEGEAKDLGEDVLALGGVGAHEAVAAALEEEGGVDEGLVVHAEEAGELVLGGLEGALADGAPRPLPLVPPLKGEGGGRGGGVVAARCDLELKRAALVGASAGAAVAADDAVAALAGEELQGDLHVGLAGVDELLGAEAAGADGHAADAAPEGPGDGVQEGGLAVAVVAAEADDVEALQVQGLAWVAVAHEVVEGQAEGDHGGQRPPMSDGWGVPSSIAAGAAREDVD